MIVHCMLMHSSVHTMCVCVSEILVCLELVFLFSVWLADCPNLFKMASAVHFPGKNSKRMEFAAKKFGLAGPPLSALFSFGQSIPVHVGFNLP